MFRELFTDRLLATAPYPYSRRRRSSRACRTTSRAWKATRAWTQARETLLGMCPCVDSHGIARAYRRVVLYFPFFLCCHQHPSVDFIALSEPYPVAPFQCGDCQLPAVWTTGNGPGAEGDRAQGIGRQCRPPYRVFRAAVALRLALGE